MKSIVADNQFNDFEKYEVDIFDNKIQINVAIKNPILNEQKIYEMSTEMSFENADEMNFHVADFDGDLRIKGHYTVMGRIGMCGNVIRLDLPTIVEIGKCVKRLFHKSRTLIADYLGQKMSCILFEYSPEDISCSYIPFISYEDAVLCMKKKYDETKRAYHYLISEKLSDCFNDNARLVFNNGNSTVWQIVRY